MAARSFIKKTPYLDTEDTLEEVGISRRQLNYWREKELFTPELGADSNKFTEKDIKLLKFARGLIVEQQFPVEVAKRLIEAATSATSGWQQIELDDFQYLDVKSGTLLSKQSLESLLWGEFGASATENEVEERLYDLTLLLFRLVRGTRPSPAQYAERRDEVFRSLYEWEMAARLNWGPTSGNHQPHLHVDPELWNESTRLEQPEEWLLLADRRLHPFQFADNSDAANSGQWGRFFTADAVQGALHTREPAKQGGSVQADEVPWDDGEPPF